MGLWGAISRLYFYLFDRLVLYPLIRWTLSRVNPKFLNLGLADATGRHRVIERFVREHSQFEGAELAHVMLYERALCSHPAWPTLDGVKILEVGCGLGGGLEWVSRSRPEGIGRLVGIDRVVSGLELRGVELVQGDAHRLPFPDASFDLILNVESSHLYSDFPRFLLETRRVLTDGGFLCIADLRFASQLPAFHQLVSSAGFRAVDFLDISEDVVAGTRLTSARYDSLLARHFPWILRTLLSSSLRETYCAPGTKFHDRLVRRERVYFAGCWQRLP